MLLSFGERLLQVPVWRKKGRKTGGGRGKNAIRCGGMSAWAGSFLWVFSERPSFIRAFTGQSSLGTLERDWTKVGQSQRARVPATFLANFFYLMYYLLF